MRSDGMKLVEMDGRVKDAPANRARRGEFFAKLPREHVPLLVKPPAAKYFNLRDQVIAFAMAVVIVAGFGAVLFAMGRVYLWLRGRQRKRSAKAARRMATAAQ